MHSSLIPAHARLLDDGLPPPVCPIFDFHMHVGPAEENAPYTAAAEEYGITHAVGLMHNVSPRNLSERFGDFFVPGTWGEWPVGDADTAWIAAEVKRIEIKYQQGCRILKYKRDPKQGLPEIWLDDPGLEPVLERAAELGYVLMAHISEPSCWWPERFNPKTAGNKEDYFPQIDTILTRHPTLKYVGAHLGGWPENLTYLQRMIDTYPNYHIDTSATKWVLRELSRQPQTSRTFFLQNYGRILFGTDLVVMFGDSPDYFTSRMYMQRIFLEGSGEMPSMIRDPDATAPDFPDGPVVACLNLPEDALTAIYSGNALRLLS